MNSKNEKSGLVSEWALERLATGDLPGPIAAGLRQRLAEEAQGLQRLERLAAANAEILAAYPPAGMADQIRRRASAKRAEGASAVEAAVPAAAPQSEPGTRRTIWALTLGTPALALATLAVALWLRPHSGVGPWDGVGAGAGDRSGSGSGLEDTGERSKGLRPGLHVYRRAGDSVERLLPGAPAHAGDRLQLAYVAAGRRYGAVLSVDGAGQVTFHLPAGGGPAVRLRFDGEVALADAYELDAAPGYEQFVFFTGNVAFDTSSLAGVVRGSAPLPAGMLSVSFTVRKE